MVSIQKQITRWFKNNLVHTLRLYPPFLGAGIYVAEASDDYRYMRIEMPLRFYNRNYFGTQFGGSLYSMCDPFYVLMLVKNIGPDYIVWNSSSSIDFQRPGRGTVYAEFQLTERRIQQLRDEADRQSKIEPTFAIDIFDAQGQVVAVVEQKLYIRRKT